MRRVGYRDVDTRAPRRAAVRRVILVEDLSDVAREREVACDPQRRAAAEREPRFPDDERVCKDPRRANHAKWARPPRGGYFAVDALRREIVRHLAAEVERRAVVLAEQVVTREKLPLVRITRREL